ncbi:hypothetical protein FOCC_FOCC008237, partial [Frankliniella occidentalis]
MGGESTRGKIKWKEIGATQVKEEKRRGGKNGVTMSRTNNRKLSRGRVKSFLLLRARREGDEEGGGGESRGRYAAKHGPGRGGGGERKGYTADQSEYLVESGIGKVSGIGWAAVEKRDGGWATGGWRLSSGLSNSLFGEQAREFKGTGRQRRIKREG